MNGGRYICGREWLMNKEANSASAAAHMESWLKSSLVRKILKSRKPNMLPLSSENQPWCHLRIDTKPVITIPG